MEARIQEIKDKQNSIQDKLTFLRDKRESFIMTISTSRTKLNTHDEYLGIVCGDCDHNIREKYSLTGLDVDINKATKNLNIADENIQKYNLEYDKLKIELTELQMAVNKANADKLEEANRKQKEAEELRLVEQKKAEELRLKEQQEAEERLRKGKAEAEAKLAEERLKQEAERKKELEAQRKKNEYDNKVRALGEQIAQCDSNEVTIDANMDKLKATAAELKTRKSPFESMITEAEVKLTADKDSLVKQQTTMQYHKLIQHVVAEDGVKRVIIEDLVDILNKRVRYYLAKMGTNYVCTFDTNFEVEFLTTGGVSTYANFSGGEKARINVATLVAFMDLHTALGGFESKTLNIDELLDSALDTNGLTHMLNILREMIQTGAKSSINVISHRECADAEQFDSIIDILKSNGVTKIRK